MTVVRLSPYEAYRAIECGKRIFLSISNRTKEKKYTWGMGLRQVQGKFTGWTVSEIPEELFNKVKLRINKEL